MRVEDDKERRAEPPGPVATEGHYDTGPAEQSGTAAEEAALDDVDGGDFPPDDHTRPDGTPVDEVSAGQPAVGVAHVPNGNQATPADAEQAPQAEAPQAETEHADEARTEDVEPEDHAQATEKPPAGEELAPGDVPTEVAAAFWQLEVVDGFRDRWQLIQLRFIDDPRHAAEQAQALVTDVIQGFTDAVGRQRDELNRWESSGMDDTEELRMTVRQYRDLLDRLLSL
jgi:hypothetical protein